MSLHKTPRGTFHRNLGKLPDDRRYLQHFASGPLFGWIYFLVADSMQIVKIGATNRWDGHLPLIQPRIDEVKQKSPFVKFTRAPFITPIALQMSEPEVMDHFDAYRFVNPATHHLEDTEWFQLTDDLKEFVDSVDKLNQEFDRYSKEVEEYYKKVGELESKGLSAEVDMPKWPDVKPWKFLEKKPTPPKQKLIDFKPVFGE